MRRRATIAIAIALFLIVAGGYISGSTHSLFSLSLDDDRATSPPLRGSPLLFWGLLPDYRVFPIRTEPTHVYWRDVFIKRARRRAATVVIHYTRSRLIQSPSALIVLLLFYKEKEKSFFNRGGRIDRLLMIATTKMELPSRTHTSSGESFEKTRGGNRSGVHLSNRSSSTTSRHPSSCTK